MTSFFQGTQMKTIQTKRGPRTVQSFPATSEFWAWWRANSHPEWVSVSKDGSGKWWVSIWGTDTKETQRNLKYLARLQREESSSNKREIAGSDTCPACGEDEAWEVGCNHPWHDRW
jgi:hypothetical protein